MPSEVSFPQNSSAHLQFQNRGTPADWMSWISRIFSCGGHFDTNESCCVSRVLFPTRFRFQNERTNCGKVPFFGTSPRSRTMLKLKTYKCLNARMKHRKFIITEFSGQMVLAEFWLSRAELMTKLTESYSAYEYRIFGQFNMVQSHASETRIRMKMEVLWHVEASATAGRHNDRRMIKSRRFDRHLCENPTKNKFRCLLLCSESKIETQN
jgi:hypothetical protein